MERRCMALSHGVVWRHGVAVSSLAGGDWRVRWHWHGTGSGAVAGSVISSSMVVASHGGVAS